MSYVFERIIRETIVVESVTKNFFKYREFRRVRQDKSACGFCQKNFQLEDTMNFAFTKGRTNELICDECAQKAIDGGAEEVIRN